MSESSSETVRRTGQCLCGNIRYSIPASADDVGACHCKMCQRWTGSALVTLTVAANDFELHQGEVATFSSSDWAERAFCGNCGSGLYYRVLAPGDHHGMRYVATGTLDDTNGLRLGHEIFHDKRSRVFEFAGETQKKTEAEVMAEFAG